MKLLKSILQEVIGLFVDDGSLALHLVILIAAVATTVHYAGLSPLLGGGLLLLGCIAILILSLKRKLDG